MNQESQREQMRNSLMEITEVFKDCNADYRILGSTLLVVHTNRVFRRINDVDVLLDGNAWDCVSTAFKRDDFRVTQKSKGGFSWFEFKKEGCLGLTFLLVGKFTAEYFTWPFMKCFELRIKSDYLQPTEYRFDGITFTGIPLASAIAGIRQSFLNPKRKLDREILKEEVAKTKVKAYNNISVYFLGIKFPYLYDSFSLLYNIVGGVRVLFGRKYEVWD